MHNTTQAENLEICNLFLQVLETVRQVLDTVLHDHMTSVVLNASKKDQTDDLLYFDDFLGDGDLDLFNRSKVGTSSCITANRPM